VIGQGQTSTDRDAVVKVAVIVSFVTVMLFMLVALALWYSLTMPAAGAASVTPDELAVKVVQNEIYKRFFEIFITVTALMAAFSTVFGVGIYSVLKARIARVIEGKIDEQVRVAQARTLSLAFNEFSFSMFMQYEPLLQKQLDPAKGLTELENADCLEWISSALRLAAQGEEAYSDLPTPDQALFLSTARGMRARAHILNQILYGETAKLAVSGKTLSRENTHQLIASADELFEMAQSKVLAEDSYSWWEAVETVGFAKLWRRTSRQNAVCGLCRRIKL